MLGSVDSVTSLTFLLMAFTLPSPISSSSRSCNTVAARPHPEGFCGFELARLHRNFCFLLRMEYPDIFSMAKRSADPSRSGSRSSSKSSARQARNVGSIPLSFLARVDIVPAKGHEVEGIPGNALVPDDLNLDVVQHGDLYDSEVKDETLTPFPGLLHVLHKRSSRQKRDLVCDCCYNACSQQRLALYC